MDHFAHESSAQSQSQPGIERVQSRALADISRLRHAVIATQPVHRLQIHPIVHN